jgi:hypothetical protein
VGGALYRIGDFQLPFVTVGAVGLFSAFCLLGLVPDVRKDNTEDKDIKSLTFSEVAKVRCINANLANKNLPCTVMRYWENQPNHYLVETHD